MSLEYLTAVWRDPYYTEKDKTKLLVALAIADFADAGGLAYPGVERLAQKSRSTPRFVQIVCRELEKDKKLEILIGKGRNGTNLYRLLGVKPDHPANGSVPVNGGEAGSGRNQIRAKRGGSGSGSGTDSGSGSPDHPIRKEPSGTVKNHQEPASASPSVFPIELDSEAFKIAWNDYIIFRAASRFVKLQPQSVSAKLKEMAEWGESAAIEAIRTTISNGWKGLFAPKSVPVKNPRHGEYPEDFGGDKLIVKIDPNSPDEPF